jgi:hypothetical protein
VNAGGGPLEIDVIPLECSCLPDPCTGVSHEEDQRIVLREALGSGLEQLVEFVAAENLRARDCQDTRRRAATSSLPAPNFDGIALDDLLALGMGQDLPKDVQSEIDRSRALGSTDVDAVVVEALDFTAADRLEITGAEVRCQVNLELQAIRTSRPGGDVPRHAPVQRDFDLTAKPALGKLGEAGDLA